MGDSHGIKAVTPRLFSDRLHEHFECADDEVLTIPQLLHIKAAFERMFWDAYYDTNTPCPHDGSKWSLPDGIERCGQCGRRLLAVSEAANE